MSYRLMVFILISMGYCFADKTKILDTVCSSKISDDHKLEAYATPFGLAPDENGKQAPYGMRLYLRPSGLNKRGKSIISNERFVEYQWEPKGHLLGVENHWDNHSSDVYVYQVDLEPDGEHIDYKLVFVTPKVLTYDVKWFITGWDSVHRVIHLRREEFVHPEYKIGLQDQDHLADLNITTPSFTIGMQPVVAK